MRKIALSFTICVLSLFIAGGVLAEKKNQPSKTISADKAQVLLLQGNQRFVKGEVIHPHQSAKERIRTAKEGQKPMAAILSCSDSRVPSEILFDAGLGDLFVVRLAGNVVGKEAVGSLEYAVEHLGTKLILVLGHTECGAVTAAVNNDQATGDLLAIINEIKPVVTKVKAAHKDLVGEKLVLEAIKMNVQQSIEEIINSSSLLKKRWQAGDIKIVGALYDLETGSVTILKPSL